MRNLRLIGFKTSFVLLMCLTLALNCKKIPSVSIENEFDPEQPGFILEPPSSINCSINTRSHHVYIHFNSEVINKIFEDGFLIEKYTSKENLFSVLGEFYGNANEKIFYDDSGEFDIRQIYRVKSFINLRNGERIFSEPLKCSINQLIDYIVAEVESPYQVKIHFAAFVANNQHPVILERSINNIRNFELVDTLIDYSTSPFPLWEYTDELDIPLQGVDSIVYRTYLHDGTFSSDTTYSNVLQIN